VKPTRRFASAAIIAALAGVFVAGPAPRLKAAEPAMTREGQTVRPGTDGKLLATVGKSLIIDSPLNIEKISVANGDLVEAVAINPKEVLINGKAAGETSLIVWQQGGARLVYDLTVRVSPMRLEAVREQLAREFPDDDINVTYDNDTAFVRGTVKDLIAAQRVMAIVSTLGRTVNLLHVKVPAEEPQIMLHVKFIDVDRSASQQLGLAIASAAGNQYTGFSTGVAGGTGIDSTGTFSLSNALNVFLFRKDINLGAAIQALESKNLAETLAEPNVLALNGQQASFLSGGEFPVPMTQGSASLGTVTITYQEYGIRLTFLPVVTPRGTIQLQVNPEVSSLDYSNAVTLGGFTVPATSVRRIRTEVELEEGQSFVIAGLIDNSFTESLSKIPGLANIPLLGKLFTSRNIQKSNSELMVLVTPEIVRPVPKGAPLPDLNRPKPFMPTNTATGVSQPSIDKTGPVPLHAPQSSVPYEQLLVPAPRMGVNGQQSQSNGLPSATAPAVGADGQPAPAAAPAASGSSSQPTGPVKQ
jgi:pilus assembly protein CpaC